MKPILVFALMFLLLVNMAFALDTNFYYRLTDVTERSGGPSLTNNGAANFSIGKLGDAVFLNGADQSLTVNPDTTFTTNFTINMWINRTTGWDQEYKTIFFIEKDNLNKIILRENARTGRIQTQAEIGGSQQWSISSTTELSNSSWYMITLRYNATNVSLFINGSLESSALCAGCDFKDLTTMLYLGVDNGAGYWNGGIDDVAMLPYAVTDEWIADRWNSGNGAELNDYQFNVTFWDYQTYLGKNYTRTLRYNLSYYFRENNEDLRLYIYANQILIQTHDLNDNSSGTVNSSYKYTINGNYNISFYFNTTSVKGYIIPNQTFYSDITDPEILGINMTINDKGLNITSNITTYFQCGDISGIQLLYNITLNNVSIYFANATNGTTISNSTNSSKGVNVLSAVCSDLFGNASRTITDNFYVIELSLIDERENNYFNLDNCSSAFLYWDDNRSSYDFKTYNQSRINISVAGDERIRIELGYIGGVTVTRYIDISLIEDDIRICANKEGVTHYQQLILSATEKPALLYNIFAECYVAADYTRFSYQSNYVLQAQTIDARYALDTFDSNGNQINLAGIDGSIAAYDNLDNLEFQQDKISINIQPDTLNFQNDEEGNQVIIYYRNTRDDNKMVNLTISRTDTDEVVYTKDDFSNPNEFTLYFSYATLFNVTNTTIFKATVTKEDGTGISTIKKYFDRAAKSGILPSGVAFAIAVLLTIFGLTLTSTRLALGWFGFFILIGSIAVLSMAISAWYITIFMAMDVILMIYVIYMMISFNYPSLT